MTVDVFICYDEQDEKIAERICYFLEKNNKTCWIKKRDFNEEEGVYAITETIKSSQSFVLIYSENAKSSNFVTTELDIAFSFERPIITFKVDDSQIDEKQQFYLKDKPLINAYPDTDSYFKELDSKVSTFVTSSGNASSSKALSSSQNEAYICYCDEDVLAGEAITHVLEENNIRCWFKKRDFSVDDTNEEIIEAIENSKSFILVHSQDAVNSNYVSTEIQYALSANVPILSFKIDESEKLDSLEDAHWLDAYPNPNEKFAQLVKDTGKLIDKPIDSPKISKKYNISKKEPEKVVESKTDNLSKDFTESYGLGKHFKKILAVVIIIGVLCVVGLYFSTIGLHTILGDDGMIVKDNEGVHYEEKTPVNKLDMVTTKVRLDDKHCRVSGKIYTEPDNFDQYKIHAKYYDSSDQLIGESDTLVKDIHRDGANLTLVDYKSDKIVHSVEFTIFDDSGNQVFYSKHEK